MLLRTLEQLEDCESKCQEWHEEALKSLNQAQTVEYHRLISQFNATKVWFRVVIKNSVEERKERNKERGYFWSLGFLALMVIWYFSGSDSLELKITAPLFFLLGIFYENNGKVLDREIAAELRQIERDLNLSGVPQLITRKIIEKEKQLEKVWGNRTDVDEETRDRAILETNILQYYVRDLLIKKASGYKFEVMLPLCAADIVD